MEHINTHKHLRGCDRSVRLTGYGLITLLLVIFGSWATLAPLSSATVAPATVTVKSHRKTIQHLTGGIIEDIHVSDGDLVNQGDLLVSLDDSELSAQHEIALTQFYESQAKLSRLQAELNGKLELTSQYRPPINDSVFSKIWKSQELTFIARKEARESEMAILKSQIKQAQKRIKRLIQLAKNRNALAESLKKDLADYSKLVNKGYLGEKNLKDLSRKEIEHIGERDEFNAEVDELIIKVSELELRIDQIHYSFLEEVTTEIDVVKEKLHELNQEIPLLKKQLSRLEITAPVSGKVMNVQVHTIGGVISSGAPIMEIVPENDDLILAAQVSPKDIEDVHRGLEASIRLTAFNSAHTPEVKGEVITVSADRLINEDNEAYFEAKVSINPGSLEEVENLALSAGMPAEVLILTGSRTFLEYLLKPLKDSISRSLIEK